MGEALGVAVAEGLGVGEVVGVVVGVGEEVGVGVAAVLVGSGGVGAKKFSGGFENLGLANAIAVVTPVEKTRVASATA